MERYTTYTRDGQHDVKVGDPMPGTENHRHPIPAAPDLLAHDGYMPVVTETNAMGEAGIERRDGVRVWVRYDLECE